MVRNRDVNASINIMMLKLVLAFAHGEVEPAHSMEVYMCLCCIRVGRNSFSQHEYFLVHFDTKREEMVCREAWLTSDKG